MKDVIIVEDQPQNQQLYANIVLRVQKELGLQLPQKLASNFEEAESIFESILKGSQQGKKDYPALILLDMELPRRNQLDKSAGYRLLDTYRETFPDTFWVPLTASVSWHEQDIPGGASLFERLYRLRPFQVFPKGKGTAILRDIVSRALNLVKEAYEEERSLQSRDAVRPLEYGNEQYVMSDYKLLERIRDIAESNDSVLLFGEPGSGKEATAKVIHYFSNRRKAAFEVVDGRVDVASLQKLLFPPDRPDDEDTSLLNRIRGGTLYITDIDRMGGQSKSESLDLQRKLLHDLKFKGYDVRFVGGVSGNREDSVSFGGVLHDLLETASSLDLPTLNQRKDDIPGLAEVFLRRFNGKPENRNNKRQFVDPSKIYRLLQLQNWESGNISLLRSVLDQALLKSTTFTVTSDDIREVLEKRMHPKVEKKVEVVTETGQRRQIDVTRQPFRVSDEELMKFGIR